MRIMSRILPHSIPEGYHLTLIDRMPFHGLKPEFMHAAGTKSDKEVRIQFQIAVKLIRFMGKSVI